MEDCFTTRIVFFQINFVFIFLLYFLLTNSDDLASQHIIFHVIYLNVNTLYTIDYFKFNFYSNTNST